LLIYNLKLKLFILITLVDFAELLTDFSYTNFTVALSNVDALDRLRVEHYIVMLAFKVFFRNKRSNTLLWWSIFTIVLMARYYSGCHLLCMSCCVI